MVEKASGRDSDEYEIGKRKLELARREMVPMGDLNDDGDPGDDGAGIENALDAVVLTMLRCLLR